jgi:hypothetical protein
MIPSNAAGFFSALDSKSEDQGVGEIGRLPEIDIPASTARRWIKERERLGEEALRTTRKASSTLGKKPKVLQQTFLALPINQTLNTNYTTVNKSNSYQGSPLSELYAAIILVSEPSAFRNPISPKSATRISLYKLPTAKNMRKRQLISVSNATECFLVQSTDGRARAPVQGIKIVRSKHYFTRCTRSHL